MTGNPEPPRSALASSPPDMGSWSQLPDDLFARILPHVRRGLATIDDPQLTPALARLRALPATKLGRGGGRRRLLEALAAGGPLWVTVRTRIRQDPDLVDDVVTALQQVEVDPTDDPPEVDWPARLADARADRDRARTERDRARHERDEARRRFEGARGRETALHRQVAELEQGVETLREQVAALQTARVDRRAAVDQAVARERRRATSLRADVEADLAEARREIDRLRRSRARAEDDVVGSVTVGGQADPRSRRPGRGGQDRERVRPGRPSRLPAGIRLDTRDGAAALLRAAPRVFVDGYNVTRTHRDGLDLPAQRDWLVGGLSAVAARWDLDVTVFFDAHRDGAARVPAGPARGRVRVVWSQHGVTADDEIVLAVEVLELDEPVVVVTDDRELRDRLAPSRVDLLATAPLTWVLH